MSKIKVNPDALKPKREWKRHKVLEGNNVFRFLPPFGEQSNGYPYRRWMVTWGLLDPESGRKRPYASPITSSEQACPVMEFVKALSEKADSLKSELKQSGASDAEIKERLKPLQSAISDLRPKKTYAWNAVDKAGVVGLLEIKATAQKKLKELMNKYLNDYAQDPTSVNSEQDDSGVWFNIKRSGIGFDTEYDVEKVQKTQKINGQLTYVDDRSPLPDSVVENWEDSAYDLSSIYQTKSYDEIKQVLMANMQRIVEQCPDALIAGFEPAAGATGTQGASTVRAQSDANASSRSKTASPSKPITTKFDDDDDEELVDSLPVAEPNDDVFAMADDILGD